MQWILAEPCVSSPQRTLSSPQGMPRSFTGWLVFAAGMRSAGDFCWTGITNRNAISRLLPQLEPVGNAALCEPKALM